MLVPSPLDEPAFVKSSRSGSGGGGNSIEVALADATVLVRDSKHPETILRFTPSEWRAFVAGVADGAFELPEDVT